MRSQPHLRKLIISTCSALILAVGLSAIAVADELPEYQPGSLGKTSLSSVGSDSMADLVDLWAAEFNKFHPQTKVQVVSRGSATAPAALIEGTADVGPMARPMKSVELEKFKRSYGFEPTQIRTAMAGVAIYVSKSNPIKSISFEQLDALYSKSMNRGAKAEIASWQDLGVNLGVSKNDVMLLGAGLSSFARSFFRQQVLMLGDFSSDVTMTADTASMLETISLNDNAIGFGAVLDEIPEGVRLLPVSRSGDGKAVLPTKTALRNGDYPLGRFLNVYIVREPGKEIDPETKEFLRFVLSKNGQAIVAEEGLLPLPVSIAKQELAKLK